MLFSDFRDEVKRALKNHTMRFKTIKRQTIEMTRLKVRAPPNAPIIQLAPGPPLSEKYLNDLFIDQARIHFLPRETYVFNRQLFHINYSSIYFFLSYLLQMHCNGCQDAEHHVWQKLLRYH